VDPREKKNYGIYFSRRLEQYENWADEILGKPYGEYGMPAHLKWVVPTMSCLHEINKYSKHIDSTYSILGSAARKIFAVGLLRTKLIAPLCCANGLCII
jgi:hypothetical protein